MRNTPTPLSIAWIDADGAVVSTADMAPCEDRERLPHLPGRRALPDGRSRCFQGHLDDLGIVPGATVTVGRELRRPRDRRSCHTPLARWRMCAAHAHHRYAAPASWQPCPQVGGPGIAGSTGRRQPHAGL